MDKLQTLAPVLVGVFLGIFIAYCERPWLVTAIVAAGLGAHLAMRGAAGLMASHPVVAVTVMQLGVLLPIVIIAVTTAVTTWAAVNIESWLSVDDKSRLAADAKTVSGVLLGAINAFIAGLWMKDAEDPGSALWPAGRTKAAFATAFVAKAKRHKDQRDGTVLVEAVFEDRVSEDGPKGWTYGAALKRLAIISRYS